MAEITLQGNKINTNGDVPKVGSAAPDFVLVDSDLNDISLSNYDGKNIILNIIPSLDTPVCQKSTKIFNEKASSLSDVVVLAVSADLPFAQKRFCGAEGTENIETLSAFRNIEKFSNDYGVAILDTSLQGLTTRAVLVLDESNKVIHSELAPEITEEPNYDAALGVLR